MLNKVVLQGRLGDNPELKTTPNGTEVVAVNIAVTRNFKNQNNEYQTDWFSLVAWRNTAIFISKHFKKGSQIIVEGELQTRSYEAQDGSKRYITEVIVSNAYFAGDKPAGQAQEPVVDSNGFETVEDEELPF